MCSGRINPMSKQYLVFPGSSAVMNLPASIGDTHLIPESRICPGKEMRLFHFSIFAWEIPCTEEPGGLHGVTEESYTT